MKHLFILLALLYSIHTAAQSETPAQKQASQLIVNAYNNKEYAPLSENLSTEMAAFLPEDKMGIVFAGLRTQYGELKNLKFSKQADGVARYDAELATAQMILELAVDKNNKITGFRFTPQKPQKSYPIITRNKTPLSLPFNGKWYTVWGGDTPEKNYHVESEAQKGAFDFVIFDKDSSTYKGDGSKNEDYYAFGQPIIAPCDAVVTDVVDGVRDNVPGEMNDMFIPGNMVILKTANDEYLFFAHFKQNSIKVKPGEKVKHGTVLGLCGNSGHSSEAHLHFHIQNTYDTDNATGAKAYFKKITVTNESGTWKREDYSPEKGDIITN